MNKESITRRDFFEKSFRALSEGIKETAMALYANEVHPEVKPELIRPPGALSEKEFLKQCTRCNECVKVCPEESIMKFVGEGSVHHLTPMLRLRKSPCVLCGDFPCIRVCEPKALIMPGARNKVRMGTAVINTQICHAWQKKDCDFCMKECPSGISAITMDGSRRPSVAAERCTGCGLCEYICPNRQSAIVVRRNR